MNLTKLDIAFGEWVKLRDANQHGFVWCIYCGEGFHMKHSEACHFIDRRHLSTRFHEKNVHAGHPGCNRENNLTYYARRLDLLYGPGIVQELTTLHRQTVKYSQAEIDRLTVHYKTESKRLKKEKGL